MKDYELEFKKATESLKGVRLSDGEKRTMLQSIYSEPLPTPKPIASPFSISAFFMQHRYAVSLSAVILMFTGTAYASSESLPGDPLYAFKVEVVEPLALAARLNEGARNEYRVALLQERVEEIQALKQAGRLDYDIETISAAIARQNLSEIETSAVFSATGTNFEVSGHVNTYNALVTAPHRLETIIKVPGMEETDQESEEENDERDDPVKEVADEIGKVTEETTTIVGETLETLEKTTEDIVEETETTIKEVLPANTPDL